ncbi:MAG: FG-GAP-like repeat-containing protein [Thermoanaerobaculia bacterium]|nr:FG-GAP-like repeat-containing protein [Thermoanaerobaculia bacterium]
MCTTPCSSVPGARRFASGLLLLALVGTAARSSEAQLAIFEVLSLDSPAVNEAADEGDRFGDALAAGDFNGDGWYDLAFGVPGGEVFTILGAGRVQVLYGSPEGLGTEGQQTLTQGALGPNPIEVSDGFGHALVAGDFDGDGYHDLAVGVPGEDLGEAHDAGVVDVFYGGMNGLDQDSLQRWSQDSGGLAGAAQFGDNFGSRLTVGDFNGDDRDDLVVAAIFDDVVGSNAAGVVHVIFGTPDGLDGSDSRRLRQGFGGLSETAEAGDFFGSGLAAGDFDGDGTDDLAIGALGEDLPAGDDAGLVIVISGHPSGLLLGSAEEFTKPGLGAVKSGAEYGDEFGAALAAGDFDRDGYEDLAVGHPGEVISGAGLGEGAVTVLRGSEDGITTAQSIILHQEVDGVGGEAADFDRFGEVLASGDLDNDGYTDLVVGAPFDDILANVDPGRVHVFYGTAEGISVAGDQDFVIAPFADEHFGGALAIGPFGAGFVLAAAKPAADISGELDAGSVVVMRSDEIFSDNFESGAVERWD